MNPLSNMRQLVYVIKAIDEIDCELAILRHRLPYLFENTENTCDALAQLRALIQNFVRTNIGVIDIFKNGDGDE